MPWSKKLPKHYIGTKRHSDMSFFEHQLKNRMILSGWFSSSTFYARYLTLTNKENNSKHTYIHDDSHKCL